MLSVRRIEQLAFYLEFVDLLLGGQPSAAGFLSHQLGLACFHIAIRSRSCSILCTGGNLNNKRQVCRQINRWAICLLT